LTSEIAQSVTADSSEDAMYPWLLFAHIGSMLLFMLAHGVHAVVMLKWRQAEDPEFGLTLFHGLPGPGLTRISLLAVIATGLVLGAMGDWFGHGWLWLSLGILVVQWVAMYRLGGEYFGLVQAAARDAVAERASGSGSTTALDVYRVTRLGWRPAAMMIVGLGGVGVVLWLMIFKPF
jgi:hypothetical protein